MKNFRNYIFLAVLILIVALLCGCSEDDNEYDVIGDLKDMVFESYGNQTIGNAANATLSDVDWSYDDTPSFNGGACYKASLTGKLDGTEIAINFEVLYKYMQMANDGQEVETTVVSVVVDGVTYSDGENISAVMSAIYGN